MTIALVVEVITEVMKMQIVIDISDEIYNIVKERNLRFEEIYDIEESIKNCTVIPRGHGRLIDADDIDNHIIGHVDTRSCPTIIKADGGAK